MHPVRAISRGRLVATQFNERFQPGCSAGASAERMGSCTMSMSRSRTLQLQAIHDVMLCPGFEVNSERVFGEVNARLPVPSSSDCLAGEGKP